jgi:hypothetical protein
MFCGDECVKVVEEQIKTIFESRETPRAGGLRGSNLKSPPPPQRGGGGGRKPVRIKDPQQCSLVFRGHINMYDYVTGFNNVLAESSNLKEMTSSASSSSSSSASSSSRVRVDPSHLQFMHRVFFVTFLREPVSRAVSEFRHITEGIVAQFGPV